MPTTTFWSNVVVCIECCPNGNVGSSRQLAEARLKSKTEAEAKAEERAQRVKHYTEAETDYRAGLNDQMLRLELANPIGPRTGVPLVSDHRLKQEIEAGRSVWVARRAQRARERAAQH